MNDHIELNRNFLDYSENDNSEEAIQSSYFSMYGGKDTNTYWDDLLKSKIIIVLGEAGSGKTWELREQARKNRDNQPFSFFIRLDKLVNNNLEDIIDNNDVTLFYNWRTSNDQSTRSDLTESTFSLPFVRRRNPGSDSLIQKRS